MLITSVESPEVAARWNNGMQALVEGIGFGIPANTSSDPRHRTRSDAPYNAGAGGDISMWPPSIGLAATFDPDLVHRFGTIASREYRALGIATALSPQIDLATDPRWYRFSGTFGEDPRSRDRHGPRLRRRVPDVGGRCDDRGRVGIRERERHGQALAGRRVG